MNNYIFFEDACLLKKGNPFQIIITPESFGNYLFSPVNDNRIPRSFLVKRLIIGTSILLGMIGIHYLLL